MLDLRRTRSSQPSMPEAPINAGKGKADGVAQFEGEPKLDKHEPPKVAPDDEDQLWIAPVLVAPRTEVSAPQGLTLSNSFSTLDDDDDETGANAPEPTPRREHSWHHNKAEIVDSEECEQTSQNGYIFTCPEPGNTVQHSCNDAAQVPMHRARGHTGAAGKLAAEVFEQP